MNPTQSVYFSMIQIPNFKNMQSEFHGIKELYITFGRVGGIAFTMFVPRLGVSPIIAILVLTLTQYVMVFLLKYSYSIFEKNYLKS